MTSLTLARLVAAVSPFLLSAPLKGQHDAASCRDLTVYENRNQVDYGPLRVGSVRGVARLDVEGSATGSAIAGACLSLFTEGDHRWLKGVTADSKGRFQFAAVKPGRYRLLAKASGLCVANVSIAVEESSRAKGADLVVHFRPTGIDSCSFVECVRK